MRGVHLVPPMELEPPPDFVAFVAVHLADVQREAARLTGGPQHAHEVYPEALADVAGHWRRLRLRSRLARDDVAARYLTRRLQIRAGQWREERIYPVDVQLSCAPVRRDVPAGIRDVPVSIALRKAALLPGTERRYARPVAEACIAWNHAWRRAYWHRLARTAAAVVLVLGALFQVLPALPNGN
jgi:hypothetical protein